MNCVLNFQFRNRNKRSSFNLNVFDSKLFCMITDIVITNKIYAYQFLSKY